MSENLRAVPLPEVAEHTDKIRLDGLGLPVGFDEEQLLVNVTILERFRKANGLGSISFKAEYRPEEYPTVQGVDKYGVAILGSLQPRHKQKPAHVFFLDEPFLEVTMPLHEPSPGQKWVMNMLNSLFRTFSIMDVGITLDLRQRDEYLRNQKKASSVRDPRAQANYLNFSIRQGLAEVNRTLNTNKYLLSWTGFAYGAGVTVSELAPNFGILKNSDLENFTGALAIRPTITILASLAMAAFAKRRAGIPTKEGFVEVMKYIRQSFVWGATLDRYLLSKAALATGGRLIKVQK